MSDPLRWMESGDSDELTRWRTSQNDLFLSFVQRLQSVPRIEGRIVSALSKESNSGPEWRKDKSFQVKTVGLRSVLVVKSGSFAGERVLVDMNTWADDYELVDWVVSPGGTYVAYGVSFRGQPEKYQVISAEGKSISGQFNRPIWNGESGFFYEEFRRLGNQHRLRLHYHQIEPSQDSIVLEHTSSMFPTVMTVIDGGRFVLMQELSFTESSPSLVVVADLKDGELYTLFDGLTARYDLVGHVGSMVYFRTELGAPLGRLVLVDMNQLRETGRHSIKEIIAESSEFLTAVDLVDDLLLAHYLRDAQSALRVYERSGELVREIKLPFPGTVSGLILEKEKNSVSFELSSFTEEPRRYRFNLRSGRLVNGGGRKGHLRSSAFVTERVRYRSADGTEVPVFIAHRRGLKRDGTNPCVLYGYGGFRQSITPFYSAHWAAWLEMGGIFVAANIRGGMEYGEEWHRAGTQIEKQHTFDDFISAAAGLIADGFTTSKKLAIVGGSNGGLLVAACMVQRPELFGAVLAERGIFDMLRYQNYGSASAFVEDYGTVGDAEQFKSLLDYSPYHNLKWGESYPPTLIWAASSDTTAHPAHSYKFAGALQRVQGGSAPIFLYVEEDAGHGPVSAAADVKLDAMKLGFLAWALDFEPR